MLGGQGHLFIYLKHRSNRLMNVRLVLEGQVFLFIHFFQINKANG